ncbi:unnamed protein product [Echinostoma caproni]|uniref:SCP domain-containing protein n=1 Tax=Echinostoma caproni TaxID=27848 RepID=A0A183AYN4_9TREM|nr:unnamed protein product [Echinostoma caproni]
MQMLISFLAICLYATTTMAISAEDKTLLLLLHNTYRAKLLNCGVSKQPPATVMPKMVWNDQLSKKAQQLSDKCIAGHDKNEERLVAPFTWVGQNFASNPSVSNGFYDWVNESTLYNYWQNTCNGVCGHYTQVSDECLQVD